MTGTQEVKPNHASDLKPVFPSHLLTFHWTKASNMVNPVNRVGELHSAHHSDMARIEEEGRLLDICPI